MTSQIILDSGRRLLARALASEQQIDIVEARIGNQAAYEPLATEINVRGLVYTVPARSIIPSVKNQDTVRFTIVIPEYIGGFNVGNVMLFAREEGLLIPFLYAVPDYAAPKIASSPGHIGERMLISLFVRFVNIAGAINLQVIPPQYSSLASYETQLVIPAPQNAVYQQFYIQNHTTLKYPVVASRRSVDERYFGFPFLQRLDDPFFGWLDGGYTTDNYWPWSGEFLWGNYYITPENEYNKICDGGSYTDTFFEEIADGDLY